MLNTNNSNEGICRQIKQCIENRNIMADNVSHFTPYDIPVISYSMTLSFTPRSAFQYMYYTMHVKFCKIIVYTCPPNFT